MSLSQFRLCLIALFSLLMLPVVSHARPRSAEACTSTPAFGTTVLCAFSTSGEVDTFTFGGAAGDRVVVRLGMADSNRQPRIQIRAPSATLECQAYSYSSIADTDACALTETGTHTIQISSANSATGNYGLSLQRLNGPLGAVPIGMGQSLTNGFTAPGEIQTWIVNADADDALVVRMTSTTANLQPYLRLFRPDGTKVCEAYSYGRIAETSTCLAPVAGAYTLVLTTLATTTSGNYGVAVQRMNNPTAAVPLPIGTPLSATLATPAELDTYTFAGEAQQTVVLSMAGNSPVHPQIRIYRPDGALQCSEYSYGSIADTVCVLPTTGIYTILATAFNTPDTGSYSLSLQRIAPPVGATTLDAGVTATSTLTIPGQLAIFAFNGAANEPIYLRMGALQTTLQPLIRLFADDGVLVCSASSYAHAIDAGPCLLPHDGMYTVLASAFVTPLTSAFGLTMQRLAQPGHAQTLYFNRAQRGTLATSAALGTHTFTASGGSSIRLRMTEMTPDLNPAIQVFSADGTRLCIQTSYGAYAEIATCVLPSDGVYTVLASSRDDSTGGYELHLSCLTGTCGALTPPDEHIYLPLVRR
jgi:hypothetical protein